VLDGQDLDRTEAGLEGVAPQVAGRITVPVSADGRCTIPDGRQRRALQP
jgi:hypothetical protein